MQEKEQKTRRSRDVDALSQALEQEGCPVCLVTTEAMGRVMDTWQYDGFSDVQHRHALIDSRGFCPRHTWQLADLPTAFQLSLISSEILPAVLADIKHNLEQEVVDTPGGRETLWRRLWQRWRGRPARRDLTPPFQRCSLCASQARIEEQLIAALLSMLASEDLYTRLKQATGLCLPHLARACRAAEHSTQRRALLECQDGSLQRNLAEIEELLRKHDYRFLHESQGPEMTAWRRSIELLVGNRGVR